MNLDDAIKLYRSGEKPTVDVLVDRLVVGSARSHRQERTRERLIESIQIGATEMLETEITFESDTIMTTIEITMPHWAGKAGTRS